MRRVKFVYNPASGENMVTERLDDIIAVYQRKGYSIVPYRLTFEGNPDQEIAGDLDFSYHHILIAGGDGTVNYVVNLLKSRKIDLPIAVLPTGTANDFASMLDIPQDVGQACRRLLSGEIRRIDLGRANGLYFVNVFSCGLFTDVSQRTPTILKNTFGKLAYYVGGIGELSKLRKMHIRITTDGGDFSGSSLIFFVFNGKTAGQLRLAYLSEPDDGLLDVLIVKGDYPLETVRTVFQYMAMSRSRPASTYPSGIVHIRCSRLSAESVTPETTDIDGQPGPAFPLEITCEKGALRVLCPKAGK